MTEFAKTPIQIGELYQELCRLEYGTTNAFGTCNATGGVGEECFNTRASCQSIADYDGAGELVLRFCKPHDDVPFNEYPLLPFIANVSTTPSRVNITSRSGRDKPLGRQGEVTVTFNDAPHSDNLVDPYVATRTYDPLTRSTFWPKWLARNPYHTDWVFKLLEGYPGDALVDMRTRTYYVTRIDPPGSSGRVTLKARDALYLAGDNKVQIPTPTTGKLVSDVTAAAGTCKITGAVATDYSSESVYARIGDEVVRWSSVTDDGTGDLDMVLAERGLFGTEAADHDAGDTVQACTYYQNDELIDILYNMLVTRGPFTAGQIPLTDWQTESDTWLSGYTLTRLITRPTGLTTLLGTLLQFKAYVYYDEFNDKIRMQAIRPIPEDVATVTEDNVMLQNGTAIKTAPEERASEVWVHYRQMDPTKKDEEEENYAAIDARIAEENFYGGREVFRVYDPWLTTSSQAAPMSFRILSRYVAPPKYLTFKAFSKDRAIQLGDVVGVTYKGFVDLTGATTGKRYQVVSRHEQGEELTFEAQEFLFTNRYAFIMQNDANDYSTATEAELANGAFFAPSEDGFADGGAPYRIT